MLAVNVSDEELRINKGITICFTHVADVTKIHQGTDLTESVDAINDVGTEINESATNESLPKETLTMIPPYSALMFHKDFYSKPRIMLLHTELSNESRQKLNDLLEEFSDIMLKNPQTSVYLLWKR